MPLESSPAQVLILPFKQIQTVRTWRARYRELFSARNYIYVNLYSTYYATDGVAKEGEWGRKEGGFSVTERVGEKSEDVGL